MHMLSVHLSFDPKENLRLIHSSETNNNGIATSLLRNHAEFSVQFSAEDC